MKEPRTKQATLARLDWARDPCTRCGKYPLSIFNKTGYCRKCSRGPMSRVLYPKKHSISWYRKLKQGGAKKSVAG